MKPTLDSILARLKNDPGLGLTGLVRKGLSYAVALGRAQVELRACTSVGGGARVTGAPRIVNDGVIVIGEGLILMSRWNPVELISGRQGRIEIGDRVAINFGTSIRAEAQIRIGDGAMIGQYCILADTEAPEPVGGDARPFAGQARPITIGENAWLAGRVTVLPGVTIGAGAVITAGSVVQADVPPGMLAGGVPARVLRRVDGAAQAEARAEAKEPVEPPAPVARPRVEHRGLLLADFTATALAARLSDDPEAPGVAVEEAPFGQIQQTLLATVSPQQADFAIVWTRPETALPSFGRLLGNEGVPDEQLIADVDAFCGLVVKGCKELKAALVPTWTLPPWQRGLGMLDGRPGGLSRALNLVNVRLAEQLSAASNVFVLEAQRWIDAGGRSAHTQKGWYLGKVPFSAEVFAEAARDVKAALRGLSGQARKLLVVDLDDTLWGGIVGDVGWQGLRLGGHDGAGEAYVDFQRGLKALTRRGIVLGIVSKNEQSVALEAIESHPEMALRRADFVGFRINWMDKARNIADLAAELNLGLQSVVFLDDNPVERARVREALPEVLVPEWPADPLLYPSALASLRCFDAPALSKEDAERTRLYAEEQQRTALRTQVSDLDEWLKTLGIKVRAEPLSATTLARAAQLLNKTNQLNLSTRRLTEPELQAWTTAGERALFTLTVADRFGDAGLTGVVSVERDGDKARLVDFVLSCRVMGRKIELAMLHLAVEQARKWGARRLEANLLPTAKNKPTREVLDKSGLSPEGGTLYSWDAEQPFPMPGAVRLERI